MRVAGYVDPVSRVHVEYLPSDIAADATSVDRDFVLEGLTRSNHQKMKEKIIYFGGNLGHLGSFSQAIGQASIKKVDLHFCSQ